MNRVGPNSGEYRSLVLDSEVFGTVRQYSCSRSEARTYRSRKTGVWSNYFPQQSLC